MKTARVHVAGPTTTPPLDVRGILRQASRRVALAHLARQGKSHVSLLSKEKLAGLIRQAAGEREAPAVVDFKEIDDTDKHADGPSREKLLEEIAALRRELERQKAADRIEKAVDGGFRAFAVELDRTIAHAFDRRCLIVDHARSPEEAAELLDVQEVFREMIGAMVAVERERFEIWGGRTREAAMLGRRVDKLQDHVTVMEAALKALANSDSLSRQDVRAVLCRLGLVEEDAHYEKKREMLKVVLDTNKDQRCAAADLARRGITLARTSRHAAV